MFQGTAGYVIRMSGGVGGGGREAFSYPDYNQWLTVAVAQLVESRIVIPVVVGSSPISHPTDIKIPAPGGYFFAC
jgi:hypothetical protein